MILQRLKELGIDVDDLIGPDGMPRQLTES